MSSPNKPTSTEQTHICSERQYNKGKGEEEAVEGAGPCPPSRGWNSRVGAAGGTAEVITRKFVYGRLSHKEAHPQGKQE